MPKADTICPQTAPSSRSQAWGSCGHTSPIRSRSCVLCAKMEACVTYQSLTKMNQELVWIIASACRCASGIVGRRACLKRRVRTRQSRDISNATVTNPLTLQGSGAITSTGTNLFVVGYGGLQRHHRADWSGGMGSLPSYQYWPYCLKR
jgi:hypothetical protein